MAFGKLNFKNKFQNAVKMAQRSRDFCVTDFAMLEGFWHRMWEELKMTYFICGFEIAPETGRPHWQIYFHTENAHHKKAIIKKLEGRHIDICRGSPEENKKYCSKGGSFVEHGELPKQGRRTDLEEIGVLIKKGATIEDIKEISYAKWCQYGRRFEEDIKSKEAKRDWETEVYVWWGETGSGKTRGIKELHPDSKKLRMSGDPKCPFILGYSGQEVVIFDEFDPANCCLDFILEITDRYETTINIKGGERNWAPKIIYFTSNNDPTKWYGGAPQWLRRIKEIKKLGSQ